ncbi:MAG: 2-dehydro-3-deoxygalactonokinase, partial [Planctomycetota bacterium]|nr:2-dehydro-3-deoxygalactonokinase [Planctomycetota bacterium]
MIINEHFINCDWGTTRFRLRLVNGATGDTLARLRADDGVAALALRASGEDRAALFRDTLQGHVQTLGTRTDMDVNRIPIVISGMAGSSIGWRELPYAKLPFALDGKDALWQDLNNASDQQDQAWHGASVYLFSGLRGDQDVLRGEETQVIGAAQLPQVAPLVDDAIILLPGTHSKHIEVVDRRIKDFHTHITGELYHTLRHYGSLQHSTESSSDHDDEPLLLAGPTLEAFCEGLDQSTKASLSANLFRVRSRQLLDGCEPSSNSAFLSGLLIGCEVLALRHQWPGRRPLVLCAGRRLSEPYQIAIETLCPNNSVIIVPADDVARL